MEAQKNGARGDHLKHLLLHRARGLCRVGNGVSMPANRTKPLFAIVSRGATNTYHSTTFKVHLQRFARNLSRARLCQGLLGMSW